MLAMSRESQRTNVPPGALGEQHFVYATGFVCLVIFRTFTVILSLLGLFDTGKCRYCRAIANSGNHGT